MRQTLHNINILIFLHFYENTYFTALHFQEKQCSEANPPAIVTHSVVLQFYTENKKLADMLREKKNLHR